MVSTPTPNLHLLSSYRAILVLSPWCMYGLRLYHAVKFRKVFGRSSWHPNGRYISRQSGYAPDKHATGALKACDRAGERNSTLPPTQTNVNSTPGVRNASVSQRDKDAWRGRGMGWAQQEKRQLPSTNKFQKTSERENRKYAWSNTATAVDRSAKNPGEERLTPQKKNTTRTAAVTVGKTSLVPGT